MLRGPPGECPMTSIQRFVQTTQAFDPDTTSTLGQAFDMACAPYLAFLKPLG